MTIQDLGSLGELLAAIATLATLAYLAIQIRQNSDSVKAAAAQSTLAGVNNALQNAASNPQLARVVITGQTNFDELSEAERQQFIVWIFSWFRTIELAYHHNLMGHLDSKIWEGHELHLKAVLQSPTVQSWWDIRESVFSAEFREFINALEPDTSISSIAKLADAVRPDDSAA